MSKYAMNLYYTHLDINYDSELLIKESKIAAYKPFESGNQNGNFWDYAPTWMQGRVNDFSNFPEVERLTKFIAHKINSNDVRPRFYKQEANTELPMHRDQNTKCCVNIVLSEKAAPIIWEDIGNVSYDCALLNITQSHAVPAFPEERLLLKFSIFDVEYEEAIRRWTTPIIKNSVSVNN